MRKLSAAEVRELQLNMLKYIDCICKENNLRYSLCYGTLIGAVRHNGFIPWDDDIDIIMPRNDMEQLIKLIDNSSNYGIAYVNTNDFYYYAFPKIYLKHTFLKSVTSNHQDELMGYGVYIDVFPIDGLPGSPESHNEFFYKINKEWRKVRQCFDQCYYDKSYGKYSRIKNFLRSVWYFPIHIFRKVIGKEHYFNKFLGMIKQFDMDGSDYSGNLVSIYGKKELLPSKVFKSYTSHSFENNQFQIIAEYDYFLHSIYGDYMKLPPEESRVSPHLYEFYTD